MTLQEWEKSHAPVEEYYHNGQYHMWVFHRKVGMVTGVGDTKAEAKENLCSQLGVDP